MFWRLRCAVEAPEWKDPWARAPAETSERLHAVRDERSDNRNAYLLHAPCQSRLEHFGVMTAIRSPALAVESFWSTWPRTCRLFSTHMPNFLRFPLYYYLLRVVVAVAVAIAVAIAIAIANGRHSHFEGRGGFPARVAPERKGFRGTQPG